ncbi:uncharacterized protein DC041_0006870 [Schistosoma bovis]|uniref:Sperm-associated antigen 17 n=1 Tax=Schistosoma bovis TaxID=6184 RepID=A0A430QR50_SCHBO|nr:uncharacterized protein DC041_0006870 [Schistosoma bovis]
MPRSARNVKSKTPRASIGVADWESKLCDLNLDDEVWKMSLSILSPSLLTENEIISILAASIVNGQRQRFTVITYEDVLNQIFTQCKAKSQKDAPEFFEICNVAKNAIETVDELNPQTLSKVLKFMFNSIKTLDIKQQSLRKSIPKTNHMEDTKKKENPKDKKSGAKVIKSQEPPVNKAKSKLYKRGEEALEEKYLGDEPDNGISRYILLVNFEKCGLLEELCRLKIDIHSIIRLHVNDQKQLQILITKQKAEKMWGSKGSEQDLEQMRSEEEALLLAEEQLRQYWRTTSILMRDHVYDRLGNIATLDYNVKTELLPDDLNGAENRASFGATMFNEISTILYDLIDFRRQWKNYLEHIKVIHLPICPPLLNENDSVSSNQLLKMSKPAIGLHPDNLDKTAIKSEDCGDILAEDFVDMRFYNEILQGLPIESTSVELILHAVLEQVIANENEILPQAALIDEKAKNEGYDPHISRNIANEVDKLFLTEEERAELSEEMPLHKKSVKSSLNTSPFIILHPYDENRYKTLFTAHNNQNNEELMNSELNLYSQLFPSIFNNTCKENTKFEWTPELQFDKSNKEKIGNEIIEESYKRMKELRFHQIMQFAEKFGFTPEEFKHYFSKLQLESLQIWKAYSTRKQFQQSLNMIQPLDSAWETLPKNHINPTMDQLLDDINKDNNQLKNTAIPFDDPYLLYESLSVLFTQIEYEINKMRKFSLENETTSEKHQHNSIYNSLSTHSSSSLLSAQQRSRSLSSESSVNRKSSLSTRQSTRTSQKGTGSHTTPTSIESASRSKSVSSRRSLSAVHFDVPSKSITHEIKDQKSKFSRLTLFAQELQEILKQLHTNNQILVSFDKEKNKNSSEHPFEAYKVSLENFGTLLNKAKNIHLNEWSVEEKLEPNVLLQRLHSLNYEKPYLDVYKRLYDDSLFIISHHPFDRTIRSNHYTWCSWFHVNKIGFRPYLQLIEGHIRNWTREQEAIYEAAKLSAEILQTDDIHGSSTEQSPTKPIKKNSPKSQKGAKSNRNRSISGSESEESIVQNEIKSLLGDPNEFILPGSLKAAQRDQERAKLKKDLEERQKETKRVKSAKKPTEREISPTEKRKTSGKRNKSPHPKSPVHKNDQDDESIQPQQLRTKRTSNEFWPFTGYDISNLLPHITGEVTHMFPTDGGTIKTQRNEIPTGQANLRVSLMKDGHVFTIHKIDGPPEPNIPYENPNEIKLNDQENEEGCDGLKTFSSPELFSSITACFSDGICLAVSRVNKIDPQPNPNYQIESNQLNKFNKNSDSDNNNDCRIRPNSVNLNDNSETTQNKPFQHFIHLSTPDGAQVAVYHCVNEVSNRAIDECAEENIPSKEALINPESKCQTNDGQNNALLNSQHSILLKLSSARTCINDSINIDDLKKRSDKEYEVTRFITSDGIVIQILMPSCTSSASCAIRILYPDGAIMERGTTVAEELRRNENPQFTLSNPQEEKQQEINIQSEPAMPSALQVINIQPRKSSSKRKSSRRKIEEKKTEDDARNETCLVSTDIATALTPSSTPRSTTNDSDDNLPWLITLLSGERFWFKLIKPLTNIGSSVEDTPTTNASDSVSHESVNLDTLNDAVKYETYPSKPMESFRAYDPATGETLYTRPEDNLIAVEPHPDSPFKLIVQHADGTRLTQILLASEKLNDECNSVDLNSNANKPQMFIRTECVGFPAVILNKSTGEFEISLFGKSQFSSTFHFTPKGHHILQHFNGGQLNINPDSSVYYTSQSLEIVNLNEPTVYEMRSKDMESLLECTDPHKNVYTVDNWANCNVLLTGNKRHTVDEDLNTEVNQIYSTEITNENNQQIEDSFHTVLQNKDNADNNEINEPHNNEISNDGCCLYDEHIPRLFYFDPIKRIAIELIHHEEYKCLLRRAHNIQSPRHHINKLTMEEKLMYMNTKSQNTSTSDSDFYEGLYLREPMQNNPRVFGLTLMKSLPTNETGKYYVQENIIPEGLSSRDFQTITHSSNSNPHSDIRKLGERAGKGLDIIMPSLEYLGLKLPETNVTLLPAQKGKSIKRENHKFNAYYQALHANVRRFTEFPLITSEINQRFLGVLCAYTEYYLNRLNEWCSQQPTRLSEIMQSELRLFLDPIPTVSSVLSRNKQISDPIENENITDVSSSPSQQTTVSQEISQPTNKYSPARQEAFKLLRQEIEKAMRDRAALRSTHTPNYFRSQEGIGFLLSQIPDVKKLSKLVPELSNLPSQNPKQNDKSTLTEQSTLILSDSPPNIPSPLLRTIENDNELITEKITGNTNNSHLTMNKLIYNDGYKTGMKMSTRETTKKCFYYYDIDPSQIKMIDNHSTHVPLDAVALAKQKQLRVPKYLYAKRPSLPKCNNGVNGISHATNFNVKQALIEDPVRRRALFTSIIGGPPFGQFSLRRMRGLRLTPSRINVGVLPYGVTRSFSVKLVNWGPETAYFKIKQLPIQSGIRVFYTPGPIPAGLSRRLAIEVSNQRQDRLESYPSNQQIDDRGLQQTANHDAPKKSCHSNIKWDIDKYNEENLKDIENDNYNIDNDELKEKLSIDDKIITFSEHLEITTDTHILYLLITGRRIENYSSVQSSMLNASEDIIKPRFIQPLMS